MTLEAKLTISSYLLALAPNIMDLPLPTDMYHPYGRNRACVFIYLVWLRRYTEPNARLKEEIVLSSDFFCQI